MWVCFCCLVFGWWVYFGCGNDCGVVASSLFGDYWYCRACGCNSVGYLLDMSCVCIC